MRISPHDVDREDTDVVGSRIAAQVVDLIGMGVWLVVVSAVLGALLGTGTTTDAPMYLLLGFLTLPLYGGLFEGYWNGKTPGKHVAGIRVVGLDGEACKPTSALVRNLPAALAPGWLVYLVALASMAESDLRQRVFDRVADTTVVTDSAGY